ncbi:hypothetical protein FS837_005635 [Tulasnella sp. UAMH 9824]|nr:hypothetical protein FS837_005635 [Tulasnella sp. UAMH 9824]
MLCTCPLVALPLALLPLVVFLVLVVAVLPLFLVDAVSVGASGSADDLAFFRSGDAVLPPVTDGVATSLDDRRTVRGPSSVGGMEARADTVDLLAVVRDVQLVVVDFLLVVVVAGAPGVGAFRLPDLALVCSFMDSTLLLPPLVFLAGCVLSASSSSSYPVRNDPGKAELPWPTAS